jgi:N-acetylglucosaminyl-diphospho-decaprenol L-rhamnosyltransferase
MASKLTICIVSWNTRALLLDCLKSVYKSRSKFEYEVTVVDNNSGDGSAEAVGEMFPRVRLICNKENVGFATANNQAIRVSNAPYVLLLNPDTVILPDLLQGLVDFMEANPKAGAAGPKLLFPDGTVQISCSLYPPGLEMILVHHGLKTDRPVNINAPGPIPTASIMGACLIVRRQAVESVGLMDENFFLIFEEADWCFRMLQAGWTVFYLPNHKVVHYQGQSEKQLPGSGIIETQVSLLWFMFKHYGLGICLWCFTLTTAIRLWWSIKTAIKMMFYGRTGESLNRQFQNKYVLLGQVKGLWKLAQNIISGRRKT